MAVRHLRLTLGLFFAALAVMLFLRHELLPGLAEKFRDRNLGMGAWFALALAGWNLARWYVDWSARRVPAGENPLAVRTLRRERNGDEEPNPEFDFTGGERPGVGPSANGDQRT
jgi:hypothetical protein